jgi:hypothetical protein
VRILPLALLTLATLAAQDLNQEAQADGVDPSNASPSVGDKTVSRQQALPDGAVALRVASPELLPHSAFAAQPVSVEHSDRLLDLPARVTPSPFAIAQVDSTNQLPDSQTPPPSAPLPGSPSDSNQPPAPGSSASPPPVDIPVTPSPAPATGTPDSPRTPTESWPGNGAGEPLPSVGVPGQPPTATPGSPSVTPPRRPTSSNSGGRWVSSSGMTTIRITNRTGIGVSIELVGSAGPLRLAPGQTRQLQVKSSDVSLLYWVPGSSQRELSARISERGTRSLTVDIFSGRFPTGNLAMYMPEPGARNMLNVF